MACGFDTASTHRGGRGFCLGAEKTRSQCLDKLDNQRMLVNRAREASHTACPEPVEGSTAPMMMASRWTELVEIDHSIREDGGLCKMWSQTASFSCKKLNLNLFSTSVLRTLCWARTYCTLAFFIKRCTCSFTSSGLSSVNRCPVSGINLTITSLIRCRARWAATCESYMMALVPINNNIGI